jgi:hypothetical protein
LQVFDGIKIKDQGEFKDISIKNSNSKQKDFSLSYDFNQAKNQIGISAHSQGIIEGSVKYK